MKGNVMHISTNKKSGRLLGCAVLCVTMACPNACAPNIDGEFCAIYEPVYPDYENDTAETLRQIERNNVVYDACP